MKIPFSKLSSVSYPFKLNLENVVFEGELKKTEEAKIVSLQMNMKGFIYRPCDSCGEEMELELDENVKLLVSDGIFKDEENKLSDVIEFFDGQINLIDVAVSELESFLSDYFYCKNCEIKF